MAAVKISSARPKAAQKFWAPQQVIAAKGKSNSSRRAKLPGTVRQIKAKTKLGVTHLYFIDCGQTGKESKDDVAFYVDLDR